MRTLVPDVDGAEGAEEMLLPVSSTKHAVTSHDGHSCFDFSLINLFSRLNSTTATETTSFVQSAWSVWLSVTMMIMMMSASFYMAFVFVQRINDYHS